MAMKTWLTRATTGQSMPRKQFLQLPLCLRLGYHLQIWEEREDLRSKAHD
jgi:hypothetical protein